MNPHSGDAGSSSNSNDHSFVWHVTEQYNIKPLGDDSRPETSFQTSLADTSSLSHFAHHSNSGSSNSLYPAHSTARDWTQDKWYSHSDGPNPPQYPISSSTSYIPPMWPSQNNYHDDTRSRSFNDLVPTNHPTRSTDTFTPSSFVSPLSHPYHLPQVTPSSISMSAMHSSVLPQSSDSGLEYFSQGLLTGQNITRDARTPRTLPTPSSSSPSAQRPRRQSEIKGRSQSRSVTPPIKSRASTPQLLVNNMPSPSGIFGYRQTSHINKLTCNGRLVVPDIHVRQHKSFDITVEENKFVGYRRNYFCLDASFTLTLKNDVPGEAEYPRGQLIVEGQSGDQHVVKAFALSITGVDNSTSAKTIELVQFSPKRDAGNKGKPAMYRVSPTFPDFVTPLGQGPTSFALRNAAHGGPDLPYQNALDLPQIDPGIFDQRPSADEQAGNATTHTWERIQFKNATANNGRRRQNQQAFMVVVTLWADIRETRENGRAPYWYPVAKCHSDEVVIRGRSPNHYHPKGNINPAAVANIGASRVQLESSIPQSMTMPSSARLSIGHPQHSHYSTMATHHAAHPVGNFRGPTMNTTESSFGRFSGHWPDNSANYPSANVHQYGTHTFDPNRGANDHPEQWDESFPSSSASMPLDPLLEDNDDDEMSFPLSPAAPRRYSSSLSCPDDIHRGTPFSALSSPPDISSPASSICAAAAITSPLSEWSTLEGMHSMALCGEEEVDHKTSFSSVGHWTITSSHDVDDEYDGASPFSSAPPSYLAESDHHLLPSSVYPSLDVDGTIF